MLGVRKAYLRTLSVITPEIESFIRGCLESGQTEGLQKQTHTAKRIYMFSTNFCNVTSGNEKGLVENLIGYSRKNFLISVPRVNSIDSLNRKLLEDCLQYRSTHIIQSRSQSVKDMYVTDKSCLHSIAPYKYDIAALFLPATDILAIWANF